MNSRVNYPIKTSLIRMEERHKIDLDSPVHKYCVKGHPSRGWYWNLAGGDILEWASYCWDGEVRLLQSHTSCIVAGKGIPNISVKSNDKTTKLHFGDIPSPAVQRFFAMGGHLTYCTTFSPSGSDPLVYHPNLVEQLSMLDACLNFPPFFMP